MSKKIAIIGGSGYLGTNLAKLLCEDNYSISIYDIERPDKLYGNSTYELLDIRDTTLNYNLLSEFDCIYILASLLGKGCNENPKNGEQTNILGISNLIIRLALLPTNPLLVFTSSGMVYADTNKEVPLVESCELGGTGMYEKGKILGEKLLQTICEVYNARVIILRFFTIFGPGPASREKGHFIPTWIDLANNGQDLTVYGDGEQTIDLIHVSDISAALTILAENDDIVAPGFFEIFNIASGKETKVGDIATWFEKVNPNINIQYVPDKAVLPKRKFGSIAKASQVLGFSPIISTREGLIDFLKDELC